MADFVIDTNVLLCASAADEGSPFDDADHVPQGERLVVLDWLASFHADGERIAVLDEDFGIFDEYRHKLTDQDYGLQVMKEKLATAHFVPVEYDENGHGRVPAELEPLDKSDRKLAAAAIADAILYEGRCTIANAADTDWYEVEGALAAHAVDVQQVIPAYCRAKHEEKKARGAK